VLFHWIVTTSLVYNVLMQSDITLLALTTLIALIVTFVVCISPNVSKPIKVVFALITSSLALWNITIFIADTVKDHAIFWNHLAFLWPTVAVVSGYCFVYLLKQQPYSKNDLPTHSKWMPFMLVGVLLQLVAIGSGKIFTKISYNPLIRAYVFERGFFYLIYIAGMVLVLGCIFLLLSKDYGRRDKNSHIHDALRIVAVTILITAVYSLFTNILIPVITGSQAYIGLGTFALDIFATGLAYSIVKYHFLDIRAYAWFGAAYVMTIAATLFAYTTIIGFLVVRVLGIQLSSVAIGVLTLVGLGLAVSFHPMQLVVNKLTRKLFFRDYYDTQDVLDQLSKVLVHTISVKTIQEQAARIIEDTFHPAVIKFSFDGQKDSGLLQLMHYMDNDAISSDELDVHRDHKLIKLLSDNDISLAIRLQTSHEDLGFLFLGYKKSGAGYSTSDRRFLRVIADQLAIGLQNALRFEEIQRFNITLGEEVAAKTKELQRKNRRLEELDNIKDDFISMASHQLRTPLTAVKGYLSMVLEGDAGSLNVTQTQMLKQAFNSSQRMVFLITDLLNISRLKTGKFYIDPTSVDLSEIVAQEIEQLIDTAKVKGINLAYVRPETFPKLMLDEVKIRQVIMNFIDNAIYYTPNDGSITVTLADKPHVVELRVKDTGMGVPKSEQHHLFTKFYRATNARKARPDGTGLGLFMAHKVINAQGGTIIFSSTENKGSTFGFSFSKSQMTASDKQAAGSMLIEESPVTAIKK
jgi:signal transduction histidine kinase